jgi:hypothetical protein
MQYLTCRIKAKRFTRYATHNDYKGFKRVVHDARHPGDGAPPLPHPRHWFEAQEAAANTPGSRRRRASQNDDRENGDDDDVQMTGIVSSLKCPLTLRTFKEPYSNNKCKHTFEKQAIIEFHNENATQFMDFSQRRGRGVPTGPKMLKCPERGCDAVRLTSSRSIT